MHTHWLLQLSSSDKKDICFVVQNLTGVFKRNLGKRHTHRSIFSIPTTRKDEEIVRAREEGQKKMEMQRIESEFEICIFGFFSLFLGRFKVSSLVALNISYYIARCRSCKCSYWHSVWLFFSWTFISCVFFFLSLSLFDCIVRPSFKFVCGLYVLFSRLLCVNICVSCTELTHVEN